MAKVIDNLLCSILAFLLAFCWAYYATKIASISIAVAILAAVAVCALVYKLSAKTPKKAKAKQLKMNATDFAMYCTFCTDNAPLFEKLLTYKGYNVKKIDINTLVAQKNDSTIYVAVRFCIGTLSAEQMRQIYLECKNSNCSTIFLFTSAADKQGETLIKMQGIDFVVFDALNTYNLLEQCDLLPNFPKTKQPVYHPVLDYALNKKRFGWYFGSALFLALTSVLSFFPIYTLIWATVLATIAFYCLLNKRFNKVQTENAL